MDIFVSVTPLDCHAPDLQLKTHGLASGFTVANAVCGQRPRLAGFADSASSPVVVIVIRCS